MATGELRYSDSPGMTTAPRLTPDFGSTTRLTMWATRNAMTNTHRWSCHGKIRFERFQVERFVGWLSTRPRTIWRRQQQERHDPGRASRQPEAQLGLPVARRGNDLVGRVEQDQAEQADEDDRAARGQAEWGSGPCLGRWRP